MTLHPPFAISARLLPAMRINDAWLSFDPALCEFYLDRPGHPDVTIDEYLPGCGHDIQACFADILSFMSAAGEAVMWGEKDHVDVFANPNSDATLFDREVSNWCRSCYDDLISYASDLENGQKFIQ